MNFSEYNTKRKIKPDNKYFFIKILLFCVLLFVLLRTRVKNKLLWQIIIILIGISLIIHILHYYLKLHRGGLSEGLSNIKDNPYISQFPYLSVLEKDATTRIFPFRYFQDKDSNILPFVAVTGFFRGETEKQKYYEYLKNGIKIFGITAYKSFPKKILDKTEGEYETNDTFDFPKEIKNWLCCFNSPVDYGFTQNNNLIDISESDSYDIDTSPAVEKKYDFIYVCLKDSDKCPLNGWNAVNRNFKLAQSCLPVLINEFNLKGLIVGRIGCGLEELYGDKVEVTDFLEFGKLQEKMRQSKFLFLPNTYDASPRVIGECITKGLPVLMNKRILCGSKYITYDTGEFFNDEHDIRNSLNSLLGKMDKISPKNWWRNNYGTDATERKIRDFLNNNFPNILTNVTNIKFIL